MTTQSQERFSLPDQLRYFSSWHEAKGAVAVCLCLQKKYHSRLSFKASEEDWYVPVTTQELQEAETVLVWSIQGEEFQDEIGLLHRISAQDPQNRTLLKTKRESSTLHKMDPFLDSVGVLRVGGHLKHADLPTEVKHPILLPKKGHATNLVISHYDDSVEHRGRGMTHSSIRSSGFWIIGGSSVISDFISKCVGYRRLREERCKNRRWQIFQQTRYNLLALFILHCWLLRPFLRQGGPTSSQEVWSPLHMPFILSSPPRSCKLLNCQLVH